MNVLNELFEKYSSSQQIVELQNALNRETPTSLNLSGLVGSSVSFVLSTLFSVHPHLCFIIAEDKEDAAYLYTDLTALNKEGRVYFLYDAFRRTGNFEEIDQNNVLSRTEIVNKITLLGDNPILVVTYPEALLEKVVAPEVLEKNKISIKKGDQLDIDFLIETMVEYGFEGTDFVYEPGQFSIRGGIVDVFSFENEWPYRIEFFDDEVERIRTFNPMDQCSLKELHCISLLSGKVGQGAPEKKLNILELLPSTSSVWISNPDILLDKLLETYNQIEHVLPGLRVDKSEEIRNYFSHYVSVFPREVFSSIEQHTVIYYGAHSTIQADSLSFHTQPQPDFNKNIKLLIENLEAGAKEGYEIYLFSDNVKQIDRLQHIFEDMEAKVRFKPIPKALRAGWVDRDSKVMCYTDHQIFNRFHRYRLKQGFTRAQAMNLRMLKELQPGDYVTHIDYGVGKFSGLQKLEVNGKTQESVRLIYKNNDVLYVSINALHKISKYVGKDGALPTLHRLGGDAWKNLKNKTKRKIKEIAVDLIQLYAKRKSAEGHAFAPDGYLQHELEASFIYQDTPDQYKATVAVKEDMEKPYPMDRLICGDVGFGKTEIAVRAAFKAVTDGKQVAILVPTTILALQHYYTFRGRLEEFAVDVDYINRFKSTAEKKEIFKKLEQGQIDILIGTHALLSKDIRYKDLGLLIIDEEQKFGVAAKEKLREFKINVDTLTLTATPIPRTLQFSLLGARDLSVINTAPPNRQPIHTERRVFSEDLIREAIYYEINRGGQVFFVHNRVRNLQDIAALIKKLCPDLSIGVAHGQLKAQQLEKVLTAFINREYDVLVSTNIIETGLDIPNANTMLINNAHHYGLSDLHQLRGRVGRSNKQAFCYLITPPLSTLSSDARKRLRTVEEFSDLGSGLNIAMRDLDIRGAGNLFGGEQSGFITNIGYHTYQKILEEAILELKTNEYKSLYEDQLKEQGQQFVTEVTIDTEEEILLPDRYVSNIQERLSLYSRLDVIETEEGLERFAMELKDRFGPLPKSVETLIEGLRLRWVCRKAGFERVTIKNNVFKGYFPVNPQSAFYESNYFQSLLAYIATGNSGFSLKQGRKHLMLIQEGIPGVLAARHVLEKLLAEMSA